MKRAAVIQRCLDIFPGETAYLEIGVRRGVTFRDVRAGRKVAVDPELLLDIGEARAANPNSTFHPVTSDAFFREHSQDERFDVIFLDGLHTFEQTLRDLLNATEVLKERGIVIIDDVIPSSYAASLPSIADAAVVKATLGDLDAAWMGDVYKLVWFIAEFMPAYTFRCVQENHGELVMWRSARELHGRRHTLAEIASLDFCQVIANKDIFNSAPMADIVQEIAAELSLPAEP
jgi:hypothetical protein